MTRFVRNHDDDRNVGAAIRHKGLNLNFQAQVLMSKITYLNISDFFYVKIIELGEELLLLIFFDNFIMLKRKAVITHKNQNSRQIPNNFAL